MFKLSYFTPKYFTWGYFKKRIGDSPPVEIEEDGGGNSWKWYKSINDKATRRRRDEEVLNIIVAFTLAQEG